MSKKTTQIPAGTEISERCCILKMLFLTTAVVLVAPIVVQGQIPGGHAISGYVTYGDSGVSGVFITAVGTGDSTGYLGFDITDFLGYYNIPVPDGFAGAGHASTCTPAGQRQKRARSVA